MAPCPSLFYSTGCIKMTQCYIVWLTCMQAIHLILCGTSKPPEVQYCIPQELSLTKLNGGIAKCIKKQAYRLSTTLAFTVQMIDMCYTKHQPVQFQLEGHVSVIREMSVNIIRQAYKCQTAITVFLRIVQHSTIMWNITMSLSSSGKGPAAGFNSPICVVLVALHEVNVVRPRCCLYLDSDL